MNRLWCLFILALCFSCTEKHSENQQEDCPKDQEALKYVETFFATFEKEGVAESLDYLFSTNQWLATSSKSQIDDLKSRLQPELDSFGGYVGYELITSNMIGDCLVHYSYVVKFSKLPIRFNFTFYKSSDTWCLQSFNYDTKLLEELNETSKIYYLELK